MCLLQGPIKGPTRILYLLVVDENAYELFLKKCRQLTVDENGYALLL
jgi:hypothetical protein